MTNSDTPSDDQGETIDNIIATRKVKDASGMSSGYMNEKCVRQDIRQSNMYQTFQNWAIQNYGDKGKTKTVTRNKYQKIVRILKGKEESTADNSKFRFWVKAKGFQLSTDVGELDSDMLMIPSRFGNEELDQRCASMKRVAVVENFFDIIYDVHVDMDGRGGKHAGQKRTYRAVDISKSDSKKTQQQDNGFQTV